MSQVKYNPRTMKFEPGDLRKELIVEGQRLAARLSAYKLPVPYSDHLKSSGIEINMNGLDTGQYSRYVGRLDKVPNDIIQNAVNDGKERIEEADKRADAIFSNMPNDVADVCLSDDNLAGNKGAIIEAIAAKKKRQLGKFCKGNVLPIHPDVTEVEIIISKQKEYEVHIQYDCRYRSDPELKLNSSIFNESLKFLEAFTELEERLHNALEYTLVSHKSGKKVDDDN